MKIRSGFVSNSSSSSFVLFGVKIGTELTEDLMKEIMEAFDFDWEKEIPKLQKQREKSSWYKDGDHKVDVDEVFCDTFRYGVMNKKGLDIISSSDDGAPDNTVYIGKSIHHSEEDGTQIIDFSELPDIIKDIQKRMKTKQKGEIIIGTRMC